MCLKTQRKQAILLLALNIDNTLRLMMYSKVRSFLSLHSIKIPDFKSFEKNLTTDILLFLKLLLLIREIVLVQNILTAAIFIKI